MSIVATVSSELRDLYARESAAIQQEFAETGEGRTAITRRTGARRLHCSSALE